MKVKLKLVAENDIFDEDGKYVKTEAFKDALQAVDLDGRKLAVANFGKQLSNALIMANLPTSVQDIIEYRRLLERIHDSNGEPFEVDEMYIPIIRESVKTNWPFITYLAASEWLDKALSAAKNKENKQTKK